jgi:hypothetical protein
MSNGLGRIELGILEAFRSEPDDAFTTDELAKRIYGVETVEKKHRVAILRAARNLNPSLNNFKNFGKTEYNWLKAVKMEHGYWTSYYDGHSGYSRLFVFFNCCNLQSYGMSHEKVEYFSLEQPPSNAQLRKQLKKNVRFQERMAKGGWYWKHVEEYKAECSGDEKKAKKIKAANDKASAKSFAAAVAAMKKARG